MARKTSVWKKASLAAGSALALLLCVELAGRAVYFQRKSERATFIGLLAKWVGDRRAEGEAKRFVAERKQKRAAAGKPEKKFPPVESEYSLSRKEVEALYERAFAAFVKACADRQAQLIVVHAPDPYTPPEDREFFVSLCKRHNVACVDMTDEFDKYPRPATHLLPLDGHLSMFGHQKLAQAVAEAIKPMLGHRAPQCAEPFPNALGDLEPHPRKLIGDTKLPYWETVGAQGLRGSREFKREKDPAKARVLCVGDSFTYGFLMDDAVSYPERLQQFLPESETINGGAPGYTICDELDYYVQRGSRLSSDIVVLQVLTNDLYGMQPEWREKMCRYHRASDQPRGEHCLQEE